ncbi:hypothetical protein [Nocardia caishijiensis]|uniref:Tat (Twin-arginine translocation) pathway signal sequence n=1 Tax=Nocardia caishijiensis TaxID=184756 RepID=A0ABQ6YI82_9NOCA|nr:hypothetical protein [Nocardia caishijiensis]KAF0845490.1 hypothetical protein FNL39_10791 [Nocardia caishijiensis]
MSTVVAEPGAAPARRLSLLLGAAVALAVAFVVAPPLIAGWLPGAGFADEAALRTGFRSAFVTYWQAGQAEFTPALRATVDYWSAYHVVKAVVAALWSIVLVALGVLLWRSSLRAVGAKRTMFAVAGVIATLVLAIAAVAVLANIQGAVTPFASLLPMAIDGAPDGELAAVLTEVGQALAGHPDGPAALAVMVEDFARYHVAMAVLAAVASAALLGLGVVLWRHREGSAGRVVRAYALAAVVVGVLFVVVAVANVTTARDPVPGLAALLTGGW